MMKRVNGLQRGQTETKRQNGRTAGCAVTCSEGSEDLGRENFSGSDIGRKMVEGLKTIIVQSSPRGNAVLSENCVHFFKVKNDLANMQSICIILSFTNILITENQKVKIRFHSLYKYNPLVLPVFILFYTLLLLLPTLFFYSSRFLACEQRSPSRKWFLCLLTPRSFGKSGKRRTIPLFHNLFLTTDYANYCLRLLFLIIMLVMN